MRFYVGHNDDCRSPSGITDTLRLECKGDVDHIRAGQRGHSPIYQGFLRWADGDILPCTRGLRDRLSRLKDS